MYRPVVEEEGADQAGAGVAVVDVSSGVGGGLLVSEFMLGGGGVELFFRDDT